MDNTHLIHRQILEISFPSKKQAMDGQEMVSQLYRHEVMPLISDLFDEVCDTPKHVRIDRLEVDLGAIPSHNFKEDFKQELHKQLEDELLKNIQQAHFAESRNGSADASTRPGEGARETTVHSSDHSALELFEFFLKTGQLPWWAGSRQMQSLDELAMTLVDNQPARLLDLLSKLVISDNYSRRLVHQFPDHILVKFIDLKRPGMGVGKQINHLHEDFYRLHRHEPLVSLNWSNFRLLLWQSVFRFWLFRDGFSTSSSHIIPEDWKLKPMDDTESGDAAGNLLGPAPVGLMNELRAYLLFVIKVLAEKSEVGKQPEEHQSKEQQMTHRLLQRVVELGIGDRLLGKMMTALAGFSGANLRKAFDTKGFDQIEKVNDDGDEDNSPRLLADDTFEINNAGLVIIAPFLPKFFDALGLVHENEFVTNKAAVRAALLLQYIATGETEIPEYELILNKILCGLPMDEPLPRLLEISDPEREEVENLLESVVEHWEALKSTSAEGLQQTFLVKEGLLSAEANGWMLKVERTGVDVLLDHLPWSISLIKLPWNDDIIHVEW